MSDRPESLAFPQSLRDLAESAAGQNAPFPEYAVVGWVKPNQRGAIFRCNWRPYRPFLFTTLGFTLVNLLVPRLGWLGEITSFILVLSLMTGAMIGQVAWLSIWTVFGPSPYKLRWASSVMTLEGLYLALFWTLDEMNGSDWEDFSLLAILPLALASMQAPLWGWKFVSGCRLCFQDDENDARRQRRQYSLLDVLGVTATICIAAAAASAWLQWGAKTHGTTTSLLATCFSASLIGITATAALAWTALGIRRLGTIVGSVLIYGGIATVFAAIWSAGPMTPVNFRHFGSSLAYLSQVLALNSFNSRFAMFWFLACAAFVLVLHSGLLTLRACGYRLSCAASDPVDARD